SASGVGDLVETFLDPRCLAVSPPTLKIAADLDALFQFARMGRLLSLFSRRLLKAIPIDEKRIQLRRKVGMRSQEFNLIGVLSALDRLQIRGDRFVDALFARGVVRYRRHELGPTTRRGAAGMQPRTL